jgi:hypothetical protein
MTILQTAYREVCEHESINKAYTDKSKTWPRAGATVKSVGLGHVQPKTSVLISNEKNRVGP